MSKRTVSPTNAVSDAAASTPSATDVQASRDGPRSGSYHIPTTHGRSNTGRRRESVGTSNEPERESGIGSSRNADRAQGRPRGEHQSREGKNPSISGIETARKSSVSEIRSPLSRYLLLSGGIVIAGLAVRYLWRQLAGLAGGLLILAAARSTSSGKETSFKQPRRDRNVTQLIPEDDGTSRVSPEDGTDTNIAATPEISEIPARVDMAEDKQTSTDYRQAFADSPPEMRCYWVDSGPECEFLVRGLNYISDKKKIPAGPAAMQLVHVDFFSVPSEAFHVASKGRCRNRMAAFAKSFEDKDESVPFMFLLNIILPGTPIVSSVMYWALMDRDGTDKKLINMLERYATVPGSGYSNFDRKRSHSAGNATDDAPEMLAPSSGEVQKAEEIGHEDGNTSSSIANGDSSDVVTTGPIRDGLALGGGGADSGGEGADTIGSVAGEGEQTQQIGQTEGEDGILPQDDFRNERFKLIPNIVAGPFIVRKAVGSKPTLLGRKLRQRYFRGPGYVETDVDVGSSMIAARIVSLCRGYASSLTVELGVCLEGRCEEELPEKCIGVIRLVNLDLQGAEPLEPVETEDERPSDGPIADHEDLPAQGTGSGASKITGYNSHVASACPETVGVPDVTGPALAMNG